MMLVVISHSLSFVPGNTAFVAKLLFGYFGVEVFFCLSGFLIGGIFLDTIKGFDGAPSTLGRFMTRRWFRTIPNYYFYLAANLIIASYGWAAPVPTTLGKYLVFTQNLFAPHPSFFPEAWSLAIEEIFYFLLPLCFFAIWAILRKPMVALIVTLTLLLSASMLLRYYGAVEATNWDEQVRKVALFRIDSLMWGVLLAVLHRSVPRNRQQLLRAAGYILAAGLPLAIYTVAHGFAWLNTSFFAKFWLFPLTSLSICGVLLLGLHVRLPRLLGGAIGFIARISYSMYLSNIAVLLVMIRLLGFGESTYDKLLRISIFFGLVIIVSTITYYLIEKSFLRMRDRFFPAGRTLQTA